MLLTNRERQKLLNNIPFWNIGKQKFPKYINTCEGILDLEKFIRNRPAPLSGESKLIKFCNKILGDVYSQYPLIITDLPMWRDCLTHTGLSNSEYYNRRFFLFDGFSPSRNLVIEADYTTTHEPDYDAARDLYVSRKHGLFVHRVHDYGFSKNIDKTVEEEFIRRFQNHKWETDYIDYRELAIDQWLHRCPGLVNILTMVKEGNPPKGTKQDLVYYQDFCRIVGRPYSL